MDAPVHPDSTAGMCEICGSTLDGAHYEAREMMFGMRDPFTYALCGNCGCLQLIDVPADLARYYPDDYYSLIAARRVGGVRGLFRALRNRHALAGARGIGRMLERWYPYPSYGLHGWTAWGGPTPDDRILDVGCGNGKLLLDMQEAGYQDLTGVDPYRSDDRHERNVTLLKRTIHELEGAWDLIMLHHTLEHVPDQLETLASVERLLAADGRCVIRIPLVSSFAWEHYRENWVQLDAPRHLFLHSLRSIRLLAERAGLQLLEVQFDSTEIQFTGSELYAQDVPLVEQKGRFSRTEVSTYRKHAERLNAEGRGDQAAFLFARA